MSKNTGKNSGNAAQKEKAKVDKTNEDHLTARMKDVSKILKLKEEGLDDLAIASKVRVGITYVEEVCKKGAAEMEVQLRAGYGMGPKEEAPVVTEDTNAGAEAGTSPENAGANNDNSPIETVTETKAEKKERIKKEKEAAKTAKNAEKAAKPAAEPKAPKEKRTRENAIIQALKESNGVGLSLEAVGARACEILSITRKSWTGTLGAMKRAGEITYDKEKKLYNVA